MENWWGGVKDAYHRIQDRLSPLISKYDYVILLVVLINTGLDVALATKKLPVTTGMHIAVVEKVLLAFYILECVLKITALGLQFFKSMWNIFDLFITVIGVVDVILEASHIITPAAAQVTSFVKMLNIVRRLKVLRIFRILRVFRFSYRVKFICSLLQQSMKSVLCILLLTFCVVLMFSVVFRENFHESDQERFGSLLNTTATVVFQLLVLDGWLDIYYTSRDNGAPFIIVVIISFIFFVCYILLNLTFAVLMDNFQLSRDKYCSENKKEIQEGDMTDADEQADQISAETLNMAFPEDQFSERKKALTMQYLRLLAAIEQKQQTLRTQNLIVRRFIECDYEGTAEPWIVKED